MVQARKFQSAQAVQAAGHARRGAKLQFHLNWGDGTSARGCSVSVAVIGTAAKTVILQRYVLFMRLTLSMAPALAVAVTEHGLPLMS